MPAGGLGNGLARRAMATASASRAAFPELLSKRADSTLPDRSMLKVMVDIPAPDPGYRLCWLRCAAIAARQDDRTFGGTTAAVVFSGAALATP
jgi:hypothetical protein